MKTIAVIIVNFLLIASSLLAPTPTQAQSPWIGECIYTDSAGDSIATLKGLSCLVGNILSVTLGFLGLIFFLMTVAGGLRYLTAGGDPKAVEAAQKTITSALFGLVLAICSWFIVKFIEVVTGINLTQFNWLP